MTTPSQSVSQGSSRSIPESSRANSLGIDQKTLEQVVKKLDQGGPKDAKPKRGFVRWPFPEANLEMVINTTGGGGTAVRVAARNLSCGGIGILHRSFLHPGTKVRVRLRSMIKGMVEVSGTISRCAFKGGVLHDIGIKFDRLIDIHDFASADLLEERYTLETIKPEDLKGNVLYIEDSAMDKRLVKHFLRSTKVALTISESCADALKAVEAGGFAVVVCDYHLPDADAPEIVRKMRAARITTPIVVVTSDSSKATRDCLRQLGANGFLLKPLSEERVHRALGEFLLAERWAVKGDPLGDLDAESSKALESAFAEELVAGKQLLVKFVQDDSAMDAYSVCSRLATTARSAKFTEIAVLADSAAKALATSMSCEESAPAITSLMNAIARQKAIS